MTTNGRIEPKDFLLNLESGCLVNSSKRCWNFDGCGLNLTLFPHIWIPAEASSSQLLQEGSGQEMRTYIIVCEILICSVRTSTACYSLWSTKANL